MTFMDRLKRVFRSDDAADASETPAPAADPFDGLLERYRAVRHRVLIGRAHGTVAPDVEHEHAAAERAVRAFCATPESSVTVDSLEQKLLDIDAAWHVSELARARYDAFWADCAASAAGDESARSFFSAAKSVDEAQQAERQAHARLQEFCVTTGRSLETALQDVEKECAEAMSWLGK
jgi:hypothetical protein